MLELNFRHANSRFAAAAHLLKKSCLKQAKKQAFENILSYANITHLKLNSVFKSERCGGLNTEIISNRLLAHSDIKAPQTYTNIVGPFSRTNL